MSTERQRDEQHETSQDSDYDTNDYCQQHSCNASRDNMYGFDDQHDTRSFLQCQDCANTLGSFDLDSLDLGVFTRNCYGVVYALFMQQV